MKKILVTGATGHLGLNLVSKLLDKGYQVIAVVRNFSKAKALGLDKSKAEIRIADLTKLDEAESVMQGADIVFQAAANFSHWSEDPEHDIILANNRITDNVLIACKHNAVERVIYVGSTGALGRSNERVVGPNEWIENTHGNPYFESKKQSEQLAWAKAKKLGINMVSVLPGAMLGGSFTHSTPTSRFIESIRDGKVPFNLNFELNIVDVNDVCDAMINAIDKAKIGNRYILANPAGISLIQINKFFQKYNPDLTPPINSGRLILMVVASIAEFIGFIIKTEPQLLRSQVKFYYNSKESYDISKSINDLDFSPRSSIDCLNNENVILRPQEVTC
ncbi:NAD-dependent epimerase/dehydratase family protein [Teredinibacter haidensis]|uniref:NAD-dependent epimerase/dehydratase family protein n=1 Tax=Teredinibacter haidensis TaxID=2731755 RepID=UPI000948D4E3|nr:NAD-dependent epimerase/dehydratase family protein [Teredinibacter haidensis]